MGMPLIKLRDLVAIAVVATLAGCTGASYDSGSESSSGGVVSGVVDSAGSTDSGVGSSPGSIQAGTLTAGEYDDHLNAENYQRYLTDVLQGGQDLPYIDITSKLILKVVGPSSLPAPSVRITIEVEQMEVISMATAANGEAYLYEALDGLPDTFDIVLSRNGSELQRLTSVTLADLKANSGIDITLDSEIAAADQLDLMLVVDTTGSMSDELNFLKTELRAIIDEVAAKHSGLDVQVGLVVYRDVGDSYVSRTFDLTNDIAALQDNLKAQSANGGGDYPEAMQVGLREGVTASWRENSTKVMLLAADAPPKDKDIADAWNYVLDAREQQIHILPLAASSSGPVTEFLMRAMAVATQSRYLFLTDDSGVGDAHDEPTVDCYVVTRLDGAIIRAIDSLLSGELIFPEQQDVIRKEGNYVDGICESEEVTAQ